MENIIHCDLALRNLLVQVEGDRYIIKVADFGLSHTTKAESYSVDGTHCFFLEADLCSSVCTASSMVLSRGAADSYILEAV